MTSQPSSKILLIGWDGADWDVITPLLDAGHLPNLERIVDRGVMGDLVAPTPCLCALSWTSMLTGRRAAAHGVLTADEPDPVSGGRRAIPVSRREVEAVWGILARAGLRGHAVNWPASHPAEPIRGISVSELYSRIVGTVDEPWPVFEGTIHPREYEEVLADLRIHPAELDGTILQAFVPHAAQVDQDFDGRLETIATIVAETATVHSATTWLLENQPCNLLAVRYQGIEWASRGFMTYHPPRLPEVSERDFALYGGVVSGMYCFHDMLLGRLLELAGEDTTVLLVSDHGYHSGQNRPRHSSYSEELGHRPTGIFAAFGPGLKQDQRVADVSVHDVVPTILTVLGIPVGEDMDGRPLLDLFTAPPTVLTRTTWESEKKIGAAVQLAASDSEVSVELMDALGELAADCPIDDSIVPIAEDRSLQLHRQSREFNLARSYLEAGRAADAARLLEALNQESPLEAQFALFLAQCQLILGDVEACRLLVARSFDRPEDQPVADFFLGRAALLQGDHDEAARCLRRAEQHDQPNDELDRHIGEAYLSMGSWNDACRAFRRCLRFGSDSIAAQLGLAKACLRAGNAAEAVASARAVIARRHTDATARYLLGIGLSRLGKFEQAIESFEACVTMHPPIPDARRRLIALRRRLSQGRSRSPETHVSRV